MTYDVELRRTVDRLHQLSPTRVSQHRDGFHALLVAMTDRVVPDLKPHGWADQLIVIGRDVLPERQAEVARMLTEFRRGFDLLL